MSVIRWIFIYLYFIISWHNKYTNTSAQIGFALFVVFGLGFWICLADQSNKAIANITSINRESKYASSLLGKCHLMLKLCLSPRSHGEQQKEPNVKWGVVAPGYEHVSPLLALKMPHGGTHNTISVRGMWAVFLLLPDLQSAPASWPPWPPPTAMRSCRQ